MTHDLHQDFQRDEATAPTETVLAFLDRVDGLPDVQRAKGLLRDRLALAGGEAFLDVGTGAGHEVLALAEAVPGARFTGVDRSAELLAAARARTVEGVDVSWRTGVAEALDLPADSVDVARCERTLMYGPAPQQGVDELVRVTRPGGRVGAIELDYGSFVVDGGDDVATTARVQAAVESAIPTPWTGRQLPRHLRAAGLTGVRAEPFLFEIPLWLFEALAVPSLDAAVSAGALSAVETGPWLDGIRAADRAGELTMHATGFVASGTVAA